MHSKVVNYERQSLVTMYVHITYINRITMVLRLTGRDNEHFIHTSVITQLLEDKIEVECLVPQHERIQRAVGVGYIERSDLLLCIAVITLHSAIISTIHWRLLQNALPFTSEELVKKDVGTSLNHLSLKKIQHTHHQQLPEPCNSIQ